MFVELLVHQLNQGHTVDVQARDLVQTQTQQYQLEDTMKPIIKPMIVTVAGRPRMRSSDGGRAHGDTREAEPPAQVPSWPKSDTGAWKHQGGRANGTTSTKAGTASVANGRTRGTRLRADTRSIGGPDRGK